MKKIIKSIIIGNFWGNCYIENKNKGDRKTLLVKKYLNKSRPYFKNINNRKKSDTWKIHLPITINFISSKDNDEDND